MNGTQRDYVVPAIAGAVAIVAIVAGAVVGLALAERDDAPLLLGVLGTIGVTPVLAALVPLIKGVNRTAKANEATAQGVADLKHHQMNGGLTERMRQATSDGIAPLLDYMRGIESTLERIKQRLEDGDKRFDEQQERQLENRRLIEGLRVEVEGLREQLEATPMCEVPAGEGS